MELNLRGVQRVPLGELEGVFIPLLARAKSRNHSDFFLLFSVRCDKSMPVLPV